MLFAAYRAGICRLLAVTNHDDLGNHWNNFASGTLKFSKSDGQYRAFGLILGFILVAAFLLVVIGVLWHRYIMLGVEGPIFNRSGIWLYIIKAIKIALIFIFVTFILFIFIRNYIDPQGSDDFNKLLALVFMELQDPIETTALTPFYGLFG